MTWVFAFNALGQAEVRVLSAERCSTGPLETAVLASQLSGVASISIKLNYDTTKLSYTGIRAKNPLIASALTAANNGQFIIAWFSLSSIQLPNDTLLVIQWTALDTQLSPLAFDVNTPGNCEITDNQGNVLSVQFFNGQVHSKGVQAPALISPTQLFQLPQLAYTYSCYTVPCADFYVFSYSRQVNFSSLLGNHQLSDTLYAGQFNMLQPNTGDSVIWWRMGAVLGADTAWSATGRTSFSASVSVFDALAQHAKVYPNPFSENLFISLPNNYLGETVDLRIYDMAGRLYLSEKLQHNGTAIVLETADLTPGIYLINWRIGGEEAYFKIVKNIH